VVSEEDATVAMGREQSFAWDARFRRLARNYERLATTLGSS
jgi:hypothetical protein